jgi:hypothetical protein
MTDFLDQILAMKGRPVPEIEAPEDWKGERKIREAKRSHQNEGNYTLRRELAQRGPANPQRADIKARVFECQAPGCGKTLDRRNKMGYCKDHRHLSGYLQKPRR